MPHVALKGQAREGCHMLLTERLTASNLTGAH